jgi:hypothetical protein
MLNNKSSKFLPVILIITTLIFALNFSYPVSNSNWELVYENSSTGKKLCGNIDDLINAVLNGRDIKVILHFNSDNLHYQMLLSKVKADLNKKVVTGFNYDFRSSPSDNNVYSRISTYSTNGEYISTYQENPFFQSPEIIKVSMSWYIKNFD